MEQLQADENLGRLNITLAQGLDEQAGCYTELFTYGTRGFSIVDGDGTLVFDSGSQFEEIIAETVPDFFNSNHSESNLEGRSEDKGPEPEGVVLGEIDARTCVHRPGAHRRHHGLRRDPARGSVLRHLREQP